MAAMPGPPGLRDVRRLGMLTLLALALLLLAGCRAQPKQLTVDVVARYPHDTSAFTEGLLYAHGLLYESTGLEGRSSLREVDPKSGQIIRQRDLPAPYFGEGLALVGNRLIQLTYKAGVAFEWDRETFNPLGTYRYRGEGWGLCYDGGSLYMSNGSPTVTRRDPDTFEIQGTLTVRKSGRLVKNVNELECAQDSLYANVWMTDQILQIDKQSGKVTAVIDASRLRASLNGLDSPDAVLNGIAYDSADNRFLVTGKLWPAMFQVRFVAAQGQGD